MMSPGGAQHSIKDGRILRKATRYLPAYANAMQKSLSSTSNSTKSAQYNHQMNPNPPSSPSISPYTALLVHRLVRLEASFPVYPVPPTRARMLHIIECATRLHLLLRRNKYLSSGPIRGQTARERHLLAVRGLRLALESLAALHALFLCDDRAVEGYVGGSVGEEAARGALGAVQVRGGADGSFV
jgi:hypothetical protein